MGNPFKFLGKIFSNPRVQTIGLGVLSSFAPAFLPLVQASITAVVAAEGKFPASGSGAERAKWAAEVTAVHAAPVVAAIEIATGKELVDEALFAEGLKAINEGVVRCMNSFRLLPKGA